MKDIIRIIKSFEDSDLLMERVRETIQNEGGFLSMLIGSLGASLLRKILAVQGINRVGKGAIAKRQGSGVIRTGYGNKRQGYKNKMDF